MEIRTPASEVAVRERVALPGLVGAMAFSLGAWAAIVALVVALLP